MSAAPAIILVAGLNVSAVVLMVFAVEKFEEKQVAHHVSAGSSRAARAGRPAGWLSCRDSDAAGFALTSLRFGPIIRLTGQPNRILLNLIRVEDAEKTLEKGTHDSL